MQEITSLKWAVIHFIPKHTQDDQRAKAHIIGLFNNPITPEDYFIPNLPNKEVKRYIIHVDDIERLEAFYNDPNGDQFTKEERERFTHILNR